MPVFLSLFSFAFNVFVCLFLFVNSGGKNTSADLHTATCATMSWMDLVASKVYSACVSLLNKLWKYVLVSMVEEIITLFLLIFSPTFVIIHLIFSILVGRPKRFYRWSLMWDCTHCDNYSMSSRVHVCIFHGCNRACLLIVCEMLESALIVWGCTSISVCI